VVVLVDLVTLVEVVFLWEEQDQLELPHLAVVVEEVELHTTSPVIAKIDMLQTHLLA
tara:strand:- start:101 stop:271 length:171 start_codon:yes stop_codon:yes gene_type:complete